MLDWSNILRKTGEHYRKKYPNAAGYKDSDCSKEAALHVNRKLRKRQEEVLNALRKCFNGATSEEIALMVGRPALSIKPRLSELLKLGLVRKSGRKGKTELGGNCTIWEIMPCNITEKGNN